MKYRLFEKSYATITVDEDMQSEWIPVANLGCDSLSATVVVSGSSTPTDAGFQFEAANRDDKADAVLVGTEVEVTQDGALSASLDRPPFKWYRVSYAIGTGSFDAQLNVLAKGDKDV